MSRVSYVFKVDAPGSRGWNTTRSCAWVVVVAMIAFWSTIVIAG